MRFLDRLTGRARPWRLLRDGVRALTRIAEALEQHNRLLEAMDPDAAARLRTPPVAVESGVSYVDPEVVVRAEALRARHYTQTGQVLDDEQVLAYLLTEGEARQ